MPQFAGLSVIRRAPSGMHRVERTVDFGDPDVQPSTSRWTGPPA